MEKSDCEKVNVKQLIAFWKDGIRSKSDIGFIHPKDKEALKTKHPKCKKEFGTEKLFTNFDLKKYLKDLKTRDGRDSKKQEIKASNKKLHLGLKPIPFTGDLKKANVFILLTNPGLHHQDYYAEHGGPKNDFNKKWKKRIRTGRSQIFDWDYAWHSGFQYWEKALKRIIDELVKKMDYGSAIDRINKKVAVLQLFPYHSREFDDKWLRVEMPSTEMIRSFVSSYLLPRAKKDKALIVVCRKNGKKNWGIGKSGKKDNVLHIKSRAVSFKEKKIIQMIQRAVKI